MIINLNIIKQATTKIKHKKTLNFIPYIFTFLNAIFGFLSILKALEEDYVNAAYYIILAAIMDCFDGRIARALNSSSLLGTQLDSLCDAISFCLAPAVLIYCWFPTYVGIWSKFSLIFYLCAGLYRLAKFNLTVDKQQNYFIGLPTPMAAFFISSLILYDNWLSNHFLKFLLFKGILFPIVSIAALLMLSSIKFYAFKKYKFNLARDFYKLIIIFSLLFLAVSKAYPILLIISCVYLIANIIANLRTLYLQL